MNPSVLYKSIISSVAGRKLFNDVYSDDSNWGISCDVDPSCLTMGDDTYKKLAEIIPRNRVVYDFGAAYGFQSWWFRLHRRYIAIEPMLGRHGGNDEMMPFRTDNSIWFKGTIQDFFKLFNIEKDSFAICNYVPDKAAERLVRENCPYLFVNYVTNSDLERNANERD